MPQIAYRGNLSAATFPMTIAEGGRTVIVPGPDNNFDRRVDPTGSQLDAGIPQALYLENVIPTASGYQSVGYINPTLPMTLAAGQSIIRKLKVPATLSSGGNPIKFVDIYVTGAAVYTAGKIGRSTVTFVGTSFPALNITWAIVRGIAYIYTTFELYTATVDSSENVTFTNITATVTPLNFLFTNNIRTIVGSSNYLICCGQLTGYWSSTTTPTDFVSSLVSGAGSINPNDIQGDIVYTKETTSGFYIYTTTNTIFAQYTGNARYPWKFTVVKNSTGQDEFLSNVRYDKLIFGGVDTVGHYVVEKNGQLKVIAGIEAQPVAPDITEFISKTTFHEVFNTSTNTFASLKLVSDSPTIYLWLNRYVLLSVEEDASSSLVKIYNAVLIYDTVLQRYGRLKIKHNFVTTNTFNPFNASLAYANTELLGFIDGTAGTIKYVNVDIYNSNTLFNFTYEPHAGVALFGKFQYIRSRFLNLQEIEIEGPPNITSAPTAPFSCFLLPSLDGRNFDAPVTPYLAYSVGGVNKYNVDKTAQNHSILAKGAFALNTLQLRFNIAGQR